MIINRWLTNALLLGAVGLGFAQQPARYAALQPQTTRISPFSLSSVEIDLAQLNATNGPGNVLRIEFDSYAQLLAHRNIDSVLRLFVREYAKVRDTSQTTSSFAYDFLPTKLVQGSRLRVYPARVEQYSFTNLRGPVSVKSHQDTLHVFSWLWQRDRRVGQYADSKVYTDRLQIAGRWQPVNFYFLVNDLSKVEKLLDRGGLNKHLDRVLTAIRDYRSHDLTNPKMAFSAIYNGIRTEIQQPGLANAPMLILGGNVGAGLTRSQLAPSLEATVQLAPSRFRRATYTVGYLATFFPVRTLDGALGTVRNDFLNLGVTLYQSEANGRTDFERVRAGFYVGIPTHRGDNVFSRGTLRFSATLFQKNFLKIQPEVYTNFKNEFFPGVRIGFGL